MCIDKGRLNNSFKAQLTTHIAIVIFHAYKYIAN